MHTSIPYILWSTLLITFQAIGMAAKNFAKTLESVAPEIWESLGRPGFEKGKKNSKEFGSYVLKRQYLSLNNKKLNRAGFLAGMSNLFFLASIAAVALYYLFQLFLLISK